MKTLLFYTQIRLLGNIFQSVYGETIFLN